jgi:phosphate transport system substrate-binding protein
MGRITIVFLSIFIVFGIASAEKRFDIEGYGDHSLWVLVRDVKAAFEKDTGVSLHLIEEFAIAGKGCAKGISHAAGGRPDRKFGLVCCELNEKTIKDNGLIVYPVAEEPLAIVVNGKNPVKGLTMKQVRDIFSGRIKNWREAGGPDGKIILVTRLHCQEHRANWIGILGLGEYSPKRVNVMSEPDMAQTVADYRFAIGHLETTSMAGSRAGIKAIALDGRMPTSENMQKGLYPLKTTLSVVTKGEARGKVMKFIAYLRESPKAAEEMRKYGIRQLKD